VDVRSLWRQSLFIMITSFSDFWNLLEKENPVWWEMCNMRFHKKDVKKCAQDCHVYILADEKLFKQLTEMDGAALRKYFTSWLMKAPDAPQAPQLQQVEEPKQQGPPPLTGEARMARLKEWEAHVLETPVAKILKPMSHKQAAEEGGWTPKKEGSYTPMDPELFYLMEGIKKFSGKKYKGMMTFPGFKHFNYGLVTVYADSKESAEDILKKAQRYSKLKMKR
jgi:hypothetical protein